MALSTVACEQMSITDCQAMAQLLLHTPLVVSTIILDIHTDTSYLDALHAKRKVISNIFVGCLSWPKKQYWCGLCIIKIDVSSVAKTGLGALSLNTKKGHVAQLCSMSWQCPTPNFNPLWQLDCNMHSQQFCKETVPLIDEIVILLDYQQSEWK